MLKHLSISNYAIIDNLEISIDKGFTVITGETGAGKSILLGALSLILGQRADTSILNDKEKKCVVEGSFEFDENLYQDFFQKNDLDFEKLNIIRREISNSGKSRAFINDTPVNLNLLKELTQQLIDIHSQHQTLQVQDNLFQLKVIDSYAKTEDEIISYKAKYAEYLKNKHLLEKLIVDSKSASSDLDYMRFQIEEIEALNLKINEKEEIQSELQTINNAEEIKNALSYSSEALLNADKNLITELKKITNSLAKISKWSNDYNLVYERLQSSLIELEDISSEIDSLDNSFSFDPDNLTFLNERLNRIYTIEQKHNLSSTEQIFQFLSQLKNKIDAIDSFEERILEQEKVVNQQKQALNLLAKLISEKRQNCFKNLCKRIITSLHELGMSDANFQIKHQTLANFNENGIDTIEFLFNSNKGFDLKELHKAASGGELSRLMLTIKSILAESKNLATIIFDEVDTGVSGDIADKMAVIMKKMSQNIQVISITHLPQVAAKGQFHYKIFKETNKEKTITKLSYLNDKERVEELAKMLSGEKITTAARQHAENLLID